MNKTIEPPADTPGPGRFRGKPRPSSRKRGALWLLAISVVAGTLVSVASLRSRMIREAEQRAQLAELQTQIDRLQKEFDSIKQQVDQRAEKN